MADASTVQLLEDAPLFYASKHVEYISGLAAKLDARTSFEGALTAHLRMSGVYWSTCALSLLIPAERVHTAMDLPSIIDWLWQCFDSRSGGFAGTVGDDGHLLYTLSAVQILALAHELESPRWIEHRAAIVDFVTGLQQPDGSFTGDRWGEVDTRFSYCALQTLALVGAMDRIDTDQAVDYILSCRNLDGGFGSVMGAESHAGQVFCCVGALAIAGALDRVPDVDLLAWWLAERQVDSGGLNGRPEKQADVCYSWWILSALSILGKVDWINTDKLAGFILKCQDEDDGGIADRPDDMADVFHTFFGIAGLSLLGHLHRNSQGEPIAAFRKIDPVYALPTDVVQKLGLPGQVMIREGQTVDERLSHYQILSQAKKKAT